MALIDFDEKIPGAPSVWAFCDRSLAVEQHWNGREMDDREWMNTSASMSANERGWLSQQMQVR